MKSSWIVAAVGIACGCGLAVAADDVPAGIASPERQVSRTLAGVLIDHLPAAERAKIRETAGEGLGFGLAAVDGPRPLEGIIKDERYERLRDYVSADLFQGMHDGHIAYALKLADAIDNGEAMPPSYMCFAPGTDPRLVQLIEDMISLAASETEQLGFQQTGRWGGTALTPFSDTQGEPVIITYSFVPDGTFVPNLLGFSGSSDLFSWLNGIYGSQAVWQPLFDSVFDRWAELTGTSYVFEPNDDGATLNFFPGVSGVRGDVRIAAIGLDGNGGVLAYNNFPNDGDMVLDSSDAFYNNLSFNSRGLRNVISHEHGHGLGMLHVCPQNGTKIMEPSINTNFDGPQLDDILNGQRHYGDDLEPNNVVADATGLGALAPSTNNSFTNISIDDQPDVDFFAFDVPGPITGAAAVIPDAGNYLQGPQTPACSTGTLTNYNAVSRLSIDLLDTNGTTVLETATASAAGSLAAIQFELPAAGTYFVRVRGQTVNFGVPDIQRYRLGVNLFELTSCNPADVNADGQISFADVTTFIEGFNAGSPVADVTGDGSVNFADVTAFIESFNAGCP